MLAKRLTCVYELPDGTDREQGEMTLEEAKAAVRTFAWKTHHNPAASDTDADRAAVSFYDGNLNFDIIATESLERFDIGAFLPVKRRWLGFIPTESDESVERKSVSLQTALRLLELFFGEDYDAIYRSSADGNR